MKVTINENKFGELKYPYLGIFNDNFTGENTIVLFFEKKTGVKLNCNDSNDINFSATWAEEKFVPFSGEIVLSND
jgi:hypothetical protein